MGDRFLTYSARDNNCQSLILAMLQSNNLSTPQNVLFTKQSTQELFTPQLRKITNTITDIAGVANIIREGGDIKKKNPWIQHVQKYAKEITSVTLKHCQTPNVNPLIKSISRNSRKLLVVNH